MSIQQRYNSKAAALYRDKISSLAEGREWEREESLANINKSSSNHSNNMHHSKSASALSNSYQDGGASFDQSATYQSKEFREQRNDFFSNVQAQNAQRPEGLKLQIFVKCIDIFFLGLRPSEGGKYAGFGNTNNCPPRSQSDMAFDSTISSLSTGWNLLSFGANKVKENAFKFGSIASAKVKLNVFLLSIL